MPTYEVWNRAISDYFFKPENAGRPAPLALDDEILKRIAVGLDVEPDQAESNLSEAVQTKLALWTGFGWFVRRQEAWWREPEETRGPPPSVALLALCVLAASRMARDDQACIGAGNYYARLNPLIGAPDSAGMPSGIEALQELWAELERWLDREQEARLGTSTIRGHAWLVNIGFPISQALLRESDRNRLPDFFRAVRLEPDDEITAEELWTLLRAWTYDGCGLSSYGVRSIVSADSRLASALAEIVKEEFDAWDGSQRDAEGRRLGEIVLRVKPRAGWRKLELVLLPRRPDGFPTGGFRDEAGTTHELRDLTPGLYAPLAIEVDRRLLDRGLALTQGRFALRFEPRRVIPLRGDLELGGWVAVRRVAAVEQHNLLVHASKLPEVRAFLSRYAEGKKEVVEAAGIPPTWKVVRDVRVIEDAVPDDPDLAPLAPRFGATARLDGGLAVAPRQYLAGGEPDLWISVPDGRDIDVELDGIGDRWPGPVKQVPLRSMRLEAGEHVVRTEGRTMRFSSVNGFDQPERTIREPLAFELRRNGFFHPSAPIALRADREPPRGVVRVLGANPIAHPGDLPLPVEPPVLLPFGFRRYEILGRATGEVITVPEPETPAWLELALEPNTPCQFFDAPVSFDAQLAILEGSDAIIVRALRAPVLPPVPAEENGAMPKAWARAILDAAEAGPRVGKKLTDVWSAYVDAAGRVA